MLLAGKRTTTNSDTLLKADKRSIKMSNTTVSVERVVPYSDIVITKIIQSYPFNTPLYDA